MPVSAVLAGLSAQDACTPHIFVTYNTLVGTGTRTCICSPLTDYCTCNVSAADPRWTQCGAPFHHCCSLTRSRNIRWIISLGSCAGLKVPYEHLNVLVIHVYVGIVLLTRRSYNLTLSIRLQRVYDASDFAPLRRKRTRPTWRGPLLVLMIFLILCRAKIISVPALG